jgi:hypothetical protein
MLHRKALCLVLFILCLAVPATAAEIAKVVAVVGSATVAGKSLGAGSAINEHDTVEVSTGNAQLLFSDGTKLVVGPHSSLRIEKYLMTGGGVKDFTVDALRGTFRFITGHSAKSAYDIKTANATIGIRGTGFDFWVDRDTGVAVLAGKVRLCRTGLGGTKKCVNIDANCQAGIAEAGGARRLQSAEQSDKLRSRLPFLTTQAFLQPAFRLNTQSCENIFSLTDQQGRSSNPDPVKPPCNPNRANGC